MALQKSALAQQLESIFAQKPASPADAALAWAQAYVSYAAAALSSATSLPVTATANLGIVLDGFMRGLQSQSAAGAGATIAQGVVSFWSAMVWTGATAAGTTLFPGNPALATALAAIFGNTSQQSDADKSRQLADAFDAGARSVIVNDIPFVQPAPPIVGPIS